MFFTDDPFRVDLLKVIEGCPNVILEVAHTDHLDTCTEVRFVVVDAVPKLCKRPQRNYGPASLWSHQWDASKMAATFSAIRASNSLASAFSVSSSSFNSSSR